MKSEVNRRALYQRAYATKKHHATRLHYDLRLEWNGVLLSWALPQGPSCHAGVLREAIEMEDHRVANLLFEGVHETGPIMLWDRGTWEPHPEFEDIEICLRKGILRFTSEFRWETFVPRSGPHLRGAAYGDAHQVYLN
jgi:bifunctional non-homologous end joining protein LigD